jgi:GGDEF domain-containing protein
VKSEEDDGADEQGSKDLRLTVSIGVASMLPSTADLIADFVASAVEALTRRKPTVAITSAVPRRVSLPNHRAGKRV